MGKLAHLLVTTDQVSFLLQSSRCQLPRSSNRILWLSIAVSPASERDVRSGRRNEVGGPGVAPRTPHDRTRLFRFPVRNKRPGQMPSPQGLENTRASGLEGQCQGTAYIEIGRIGGVQSAFSAATRNLVRCEAGRVLETAILVLVSRKGDPFFSATSFFRSHDRLVCGE